MRELLAWTLTRLAGRSLASDILGDVAESREGTSRLLVIVVGIAVRRVRESAADVWRSRPRLDTAITDIRYALRSLRRSPWYTATVIGVMALSMALAITVFAVVDGVLFKPLPYPQSGRIFAIQPGYARLGHAPEPLGASIKDLASWSAAAPGIDVTGFSVERRLFPGDSSSGGTYGVAEVQSNFFSVIGVRPLVGGFTDDDFRRESDPAALFAPAVISYDVWQGRLRGEADVVGRTIVEDPARGNGYRVVGVMPAGFLFPSPRAEVHVITPLARGRSVREVMARVPYGVSASALRARIEAGMVATAASFPAQPSTAARSGRTVGPYDHVDVLRLDAVIGRRERPLFAAIFLAAAILVALGAVNVSGLQAARCLDRTRELSLRRALGAGGAEIARLVAVEAFVLIAAGCAIGLALAPSLLTFGLTMLPGGLSLLKVPAIDWRVVAFVALSAVGLVIPTTIWPIRRALRMETRALADGNDGSERRRSVGRFVVVMSQVAGAAVLTVIGSLLVSSMLALYVRSPNVRTEDVVVAPAFVQGTGGTTPERTARVGAVIDRLRAIPGVSGVAAMTFQALRGGNVKSWFNPPPGAGNVKADVVVLGVTRDFYRVVEPQLVAGRFPTVDELAGDAPVVVVGDAVARAYWPQISAVGQLLTYGDDAKPFRVVGVVKDVRWLGMDSELGNIYGPYALLSRNSIVQLCLRAPSNVGSVKASVVRAIEQADPLFQPIGPVTLAERFSDSIRARRLQAWLFGAFASAALAIVGVGIFGLMAMAMARRTREVGIRMALGSTRPRAVSLLMREQLTAVVSGLVVGVSVAAWAARFLSWFLYGLGAYDLRVWTVAVGAIVLTATAGTLMPALRASRIDPVKALRVD